MRQSKFTETQIVSILKEADATAPSMRSGGSTGSVPLTYYKWKATYGGLEASDVKRLKELEHENGRLKRMYADLSLENATLKDVMIFNARNQKSCHFNRSSIMSHLSLYCSEMAPFVWTVFAPEHPFPF